MSTETHDFSVHDQGLGPTPECSCGWSGEPWEDADDALLEWEDHCDDEFYKATMREDS